MYCLYCLCRRQTTPDALGKGDRKEYKQPLSSEAEHERCSSLPRRGRSGGGASEAREESKRCRRVAENTFPRNHLGRACVRSIVRMCERWTVCVLVGLIVFRCGARPLYPGIPYFCRRRVCACSCSPSDLDTGHLYAPYRHMGRVRIRQQLSTGEHWRALERRGRQGQLDKTAPLLLSIDGWKRSAIRSIR